MTTGKKTAVDEAFQRIEVAAELSPAAAGRLKDDVMTALQSDRPVELHLSGPEPQPCALQFLVAADILARRDGLALRLDPLARTALEKTGSGA